MAELSRSDTVTKAIAAAQQEAAIVPLREDDNDDETIHGPTVESTIDTSIFDVFTDFDLDLSCLSAPPSPAASTSNLPPSTPSPPLSPLLSRSISFASQAAPVITKKSPRKASSPVLSSTAPTSARGSWPLIKYAGRGTPIDRNRRLEWGGFSGEEVAEDGMLFSTVRSTSLDSAIRPSQRSISPEWNYMSPLSSSISHSAHSEPTLYKDSSIHEPPPELAPLEGLGLNKTDEWDSIMKTILSPATEPSTLTDTTEAAEDVKEESQPEPDNSTKPMDAATPPMMTPEQMEQLNNGLEIDLGIDAALDLGLGQRGGMNWFDLGLLPTSKNGRESPSVYSSQVATPRASPPASLRASEHRSTTSTKAEANGAADVKSESPRWWQKMLFRIRHVQNSITIHKNRF
ncbi:hypothetical protein BDZ97DRAFT_1856299 [Flammula alnicola]|nr:hypothetical protein BDZ97DRAFT_1856299 [Flammula alnicola]